jgi:hypothetical protein
MKVRRVIPILAILFLAAALHAADTTSATEARPIEKLIDELKVVAELVKQLDDPKFEVRQLASERLIRLGQSAIDPLKRVLEGNPSLETTTRIASIFKAIYKDRQQAGGNALRRKLAEPINLEKGIGPNCTLNDALEYFSDRYDLTIVVDEEAFQAIGVLKVGESPVQLPRMTGVPLRLALQKMLAQLKGEEHAGAFLIRGDHLEITTTRHANPLHWVGAARRGLPAVSCDFDREPLTEALRQLSESTGISVAVDPRALDQGRKTVSVELNDVPLDTAVGLLASMADLRAVSLDNLLYVTTRDKARELEKEKAVKARTVVRQVDKPGQEPKAE